MLNSLNKIEDIKEAILNAKLLKTKLTIMLNPDSRIIQENIDYFKELYTNNDNIKINIGKELTLKQIIEGEEFLDRIAKEINSHNFTDFEKLIAVYDIVKNFKEYKDNNTYELRKKLEVVAIYPILYNNYITCRGFMNLTIDLLTRLNIKASKIKCKMSEENIHYLTKVYIEDDKYDIKGEYISDATLENNELYKYHNLIATKKEYLKYHSFKLLDNIDQSKKIRPYDILKAILKVKEKTFKNFNTIKDEYIKNIILSNRWYETDEDCKLKLDEILSINYENILNTKVRDLDIDLIRYILLTYMDSQIHIVDKRKNKLTLSLLFDYDKKTLINNDFLNTNYILEKYGFTYFKKIDDRYIIGLDVDSTKLTLIELINIIKLKEEQINSELNISKSLNI